MADHKPLPAIPVVATAPNLTTLSVQAREHRGRFIRHILLEAELDDGEGLWVTALEDALDSLSDAVARGRWLEGVKRGRRERAHLMERKPIARTETMSSSISSILQSPASDNSAESLLAFPQSPTVEALRQIRALTAQPAPPNSKPEPKHLLLCLAPLGSRIAIPTEDSGFDLIPANVGCVFKPALFSLPEEDSDDPSCILYGLSEWDTTATDVKVVGGTFAFKGVNSPLQHHALCKALRISIYMHISLLLEQYFLSNSRVQLHFPPPKLRHSAVSYQPSLPPSTSSQGGELTPRSRQSKTFLPGILSFFSKKNLAMHRTNTVSSTSTRGGASLDLTSSRDSSTPDPPRFSDDGSSRLRRFSFISDPRPSFLKPAPTPAPATDGPAFASILARLDAAAPLLSSSAGVRFVPPPLIADLAAKEAADPGRRLLGDEKIGLCSILGWDTRERDREARGKGMCGARGFARMQELSVLLSRHVPCAPAPLETGSTSTLGASSAEEQLQPTFTACDRPHWRTYQYYSREEDRSLGEMVKMLSGNARSPCARPGCTFAQGEHVMRIVHGGVRVAVAVCADDGEKVEKKADADVEEKDKDAEEGAGTDAPDAERIDMWVSCAVCGKRTDKMEMMEGTYLFSFAKFLEVLVYSPVICKLTPALCEHTSPPRVSTSDATSVLPASRFNIVRHFATRRHAVSFTLSAIDDVFELRVPRLQITRKSGDKSARTSIAGGDAAAAASTPVSADEEKRTLRREIKAWWEGLADHMDKMETSIVGSTLKGFRKALPRLPSVDDAYDDFSDASEGGEDDDESDDPQTTPKLLKNPHSIAGLPPSAPSTPQITRTAHEFFPSSPPPLPRASSVPTVPPASASTSAPTGDPIDMLTSLRQTFQGTEQALYAQLAQTPVAALNDVRRAFVAAGRGAEKRLAAWQKKHMPGRNKRNLQKMEVTEPDWWAKGCHTAPGGNIIVREDDWGSIIAFTISTADYARELASMSLARASTSSAMASPALTPTPAASTSSASSFFSAKGPSNLNYKLFTSSTQTQPDPDQEDAVWYEPEAYSAVISRKEHPRDITSLLSLREVLRQKSPLDGAGLLSGSNSRFNSLGSAATKGSSAPGIVPPSAWSKPDVQISRHAAGGEVGSVFESSESAGKILHELEASSVEGGAGSRPGSTMSGHGSILSGSMYVKRRGKPASIISVDSDSTIGGRSVDGELVHAEEPDVNSNARHGKDATAATAASETPSMPTPTPSSFTTLTSGISNAMRLLLSNNGEIPRPSVFGSLSRNHHGLLTPANADAFTIDERPHIKYDWTVGKRLKFSCTVYYAKQFDNLRRRCGIEDVFMKSLSHSANWAAEGGKSKSNFWKTADDRFIIKTLVNAWNVADLQVLIELAPSYFRYMDATANRATVLAKLIGFYTIEIRNLESGTVQSKADLLVMENLFYDQKIVKTFDLKGIQGRKVKPSASGTARDTKTLFDGEWIEGQQRTLTLVRPHSKVVLQEAIKNDAEFLAKSNIMDYSLLLGVDRESKQIACGLVDTIGSYTFAKTLEYKAKQGLTGNSGKEVTVIPPTEYQERFVSALDGYFVACPDKWSRPMDDTKPINDPGQLPSVL